MKLAFSSLVLLTAALAIPSSAFAAGNLTFPTQSGTLIAVPAGDNFIDTVNNAVDSNADLQNETAPGDDADLQKAVFGTPCPTCQMIDVVYPNDDEIVIYLHD